VTKLTPKEEEAVRLILDLRRSVRAGEVKVTTPGACLGSYDPTITCYETCQLATECIKATRLYKSALAKNDEMAKLAEKINWLNVSAPAKKFTLPPKYEAFKEKLLTLSPKLRTETTTRHICFLLVSEKLFAITKPICDDSITIVLYDTTITDINDPKQQFWEGHPDYNAQPTAFVSDRNIRYVTGIIRSLIESRSDQAFLDKATAPRGKAKSAARRPKTKKKR